MLSRHSVEPPPFSRREQNYRDILRGLSLGTKPLPGTDVTHIYDHTFWFGDLNFRLDEDMTSITKRLEKRELGPLLTKDQLKQSQSAGTAFQQFSAFFFLQIGAVRCGGNIDQSFSLSAEEEVLFQPTYRYEKGQRDQWSWQKIKGRNIRINVPSWTDRVLVCSRKHTYIQNTSYGENLSSLTSAFYIWTLDKSYKNAFPLILSFILVQGKTRSSCVNRSLELNPPPSDLCPQLLPTPLVVKVCVRSSRVVPHCNFQPAVCHDLGSGF